MPGDQPASVPLATELQEAYDRIYKEVTSWPHMKNQKKMVVLREVAKTLAEEVNQKLVTIDQEYNEAAENQTEASYDIGGKKREIVTAYAAFCNEQFVEFLIKPVDMHAFNLSHANLSGLDLHNANLQDADLRLVQANKTNFSGALFNQADLSGAHFEEADIHLCNFRGCDADEHTAFVDVNNRKCNVRDYIGDVVSFTSAIPAPTNCIEAARLVAEFGSQKELNLLSQQVLSGQLPGINEQDNSGSTPAMIALKNIIDMGKQAEDPSMGNRSLLPKYQQFVAGFFNHPDIDMTVTNNRDRNVMHYVVRIGHPNLIQFTVQKPTVTSEVLNQQDDRGNTPLLLGMKHSKEKRGLEVNGIIHLANAGTNFSLADDRGFTPFMHATRHKNQPHVKVIADMAGKGLAIGLDAENKLHQNTIEMAAVMDGALVQFLEQVVAFRTQIQQTSDIGENTLRQEEIGAKALRAELVSGLLKDEIGEPGTVKLVLARVKDSHPDTSHPFYVEGVDKFDEGLYALKQFQQANPGQAHQFEFHVQINPGHYGAVIMDMDGKGHIHMALYDSMGCGGLADERGTLLEYAEKAHEIFKGQEVHAYFNSEKTQRDFKSCRVFGFANVHRAPAYRKGAYQSEGAPPLFDYLASRAVPEGELDQVGQHLQRYQPEAPKAVAQLLSAASNKPMLHLHLVEPYGFPPAVYRETQYLGPIATEAIGEQEGKEPVVSKKGTSLKEQVDTTSRYSLRNNKKVNKSLTQIVIKQTDKAIEFVNTHTYTEVKHMLQDVDITLGMEGYVQDRKLIANAMPVSSILKVMDKQDKKFAEILKDVLVQVPQVPGEKALQEMKIGTGEAQLSPYRLRQAIREALQIYSEEDKGRAMPFDKSYQSEQGIMKKLAKEVEKGRGIND